MTNSSKNIVIAFPSQSRGGCEEYALSIAKKLHSKGYNIYTFFPNTVATQTLKEDFNQFQISYTPLIVRYWKQGTFRRIRFMYDTIRIMLQLVIIKPYAIHISLPWPDTATELIIACAVLRFRTVIVFQLADKTFRISTKLQRWYLWAKTRQQHWVSVSENNRKIIAIAFNQSEAEIHLIPNGVFEQSIETISHQSPKFSNNSYKIILAVARLSHQKGLDILINAFSVISHKYPEYNIYIIGEGELRSYLLELIKGLNIENRIFLLGYSKEVPYWLNTATYFVHPSRSEGQSFALLEAMKSGKPIIAANSSSIPELINNGQEGLLFESEDHLDLAKKLEWAFNNPEEMKLMGLNAKNKSLIFSGNEMVLKTLLLLGVDT